MLSQYADFTLCIIIASDGVEFIRYGHAKLSSFAVSWLAKARLSELA